MPTAGAQQKRLLAYRLVKFISMLTAMATGSPRRVAGLKLPAGEGFDRRFVQRRLERAHHPHLANLRSRAHARLGMKSGIGRIDVFDSPRPVDGCCWILLVGPQRQRVLLPFHDCDEGRAITILCPRPHRDRSEGPPRLVQGHPESDLAHR